MKITEQRLRQLIRQELKNINEVKSMYKTGSPTRDELLDKYGDDPLYADVINAKNSREFDKAVETLKKIRGGTAFNNFINEIKQHLTEDRRSVHLIGNQIDRIKNNLNDIAVYLENIGNELKNNSEYGSREIGFVVNSEKAVYEILDQLNNLQRQLK